MKAYSKNDESLIEGLVLLGRTREQAINELFDSRERHEQEEFSKIQRALWDDHKILD